MRRVAIIASASGNGKTTLGRELAERLGVPFVELDALVHGPDWTETPDDELRTIVEPIVRSDGWVIDESLRSAFWGRESLFGYALIQQGKRRREWPDWLAPYPVVRLRSQEAVERWLADAVR